MNTDTPWEFPASRAAAIHCAAWLMLACSSGAMAAAAPLSLSQLPQEWRDDRDQAFPLAQLRSHRVILTMAYAACHRICPLTIAHLEEMQAELDRRGDQADFVVIGYDPDNERPSQWHAYRQAHQLTRSNWHFLTGSHEGTALLARRLDFENWRYDEHVMHVSQAVLFDATGAVQRTLGPDDTNWPAVL